MNQELKDKLIDQLIIDEGEMLELYADTKGKITGGIGHNYTDKGISKSVSRFQCSEDINEAESELNRVVPWWSSKPENVKLVLLNMMFNMGSNRLLGFKKTLELINNNKFKEASIEMLDSAWAVQVGDRAKRLSKLLANG